MTRMSKAFGVHAFAGGFGLGLSNHHEIIGQFELDGVPMRGPRASEHRQAIADARHNHNWEIHEGQPTWLASAECRNLKPDIVFGNPPCAPWSSMNTNNRGWMDDPRLSMAHDVINTGIRLGSSAILVESVVRSWTSGKAFWIDEARGLVRNGYSVYFWLHNVNALGGWQDRRRFMFVASRNRLNFPDVLPVGDRPLLRDHIHLMSDVEDTVTYMPRAGTDTLVEFWSNAKPGPLRKQGNGHEIPPPPFIARKLGLDMPSPTIVGRYVVHPTLPRCLNWGEFRHLLGFPKTWETTRDQVTVSDVEAGILPMTRGVCPTVGDWIGRILANNAGEVDTPELQVIDQR